MSTISKTKEHTAIVRLKNVCKIYRQGKVDVHALRNLSLEIYPGEFTAVCGPSGSGKSTILNLIGGLDDATSGRIWVDGVDLASLNGTSLSEMRKNRIGFVFQSYNLIPVLSAYENASFVLELQGIHPEECRKRVMNTLEAVGLAGLEDRKPDEMSGGQQQRVAIARAIVTRPAIVLADEPTANVDSSTAESLLDLMQQLNQEHGITFLFSTHDQHVMDRAHRVIRVHDGQVEQSE
ncbi:MAG: ABC transporter ATP-binding protein [Mariprofundaceae bacterium]